MARAWSIVLLQTGHLAGFLEQHVFSRMDGQMSVQLFLTKKVEINTFFASVEEQVARQAPVISKGFEQGFAREVTESASSRTVTWNTSSRPGDWPPYGGDPDGLCEAFLFRVSLGGPGIFSGVLAGAEGVRDEEDVLEGSAAAALSFPFCPLVLA
ncbi:hypothetical protein C8J56DRAFT_902296 [Mycena floridula]|nr:hypothetical protein C8J56DRAFT_902296 [Mycena floridula]